jgi:hypothetical protein
MMKSILNNPYRILGLSAGASAGERSIRINRLRVYLEAGEEPEVEDDYTFPALGTLTRTVELVDEAASKLDLDVDRRNAALFWFYLGDLKTDTAAFEAIVAQDLDRAVGIWSSLTGSTDLTPRNCFAFQNLSTLLLCRGLQAKSGGLKDFKQGIALKLKFLESDCSRDFITKVTDATFGEGKVKHELAFLHALLQDVSSAKHPFVTQDSVLKALQSLSFTAKDEFMRDFSQKIVSGVEQEIEQRVKDTARQREKNPAKADVYGNNLYDGVSGSLKKLKEISELKYASAADSVAEELMLCSVAYHNNSGGKNTLFEQLVTLLDRKYDKNKGGRSQTIAEANNLLNEAKPVLEKLKNAKENVTTSLIEKARSIAAGSKLKQQCEKNLKQLQEINSKNDLYMTASSGVAAKAQNMIIEDVNGTSYYSQSAINEKYQYALRIMRKIEVMVMTSELRDRVEKNILQLGGLPQKPGYIIHQELVELLDRKTATGALVLLYSAEPLLEKLKNAGKNLNEPDETKKLYLQVSSRIASRAMDMLVEEVNGMLKKNLPAKAFRKQIFAIHISVAVIEGMDIEPAGKKRLRELTEWINGLDPVYEQIKKLLDRKREQTIDEADKLLDEAKPLLKSLKKTKQTVKLGLKASSGIASLAIDMVNTYINEALVRQVITRKVDSKALRKLVNSASKTAATLKKMDMEQDVRDKYEKLTGVIEALSKQIGVNAPLGDNTVILGFKIRGGALWAAVKYIFWTALIFAAPIALLEYRWHALSGPANRLMGSLPYVLALIWSMMAVYGLAGMVKRRLPAFGVFLNFIINMAFLYVLTQSGMKYLEITSLSTAGETGVWFFVLVILLVAVFRLSALKTATSGDRMKSSMFRLNGTPGVMYFTYFFRSLMIPYLVACIASLSGWSVNPFWHAAFSIYGFLWLYENMRMMLLCNMRRSKRSKMSQFWYTQHLLLFLPEAAMFLLWYFDWLPAPKWVSGAFIVYGFFWLLASIGILTAKKQ